MSNKEPEKVSIDAMIPKFRELVSEATRLVGDRDDVWEWVAALLAMNSCIAAAPLSPASQAACSRIGAELAAVLLSCIDHDVLSDGQLAERLAMELRRVEQM